MKKKVKDLENSISHLSCLLNQLRTRTEDNEEYNVAYNRLLIRRAELRKKLSDVKDNNNVIELFSKKLFSFSGFKKGKKEKLICDYFS